jgi:hypothetical protein
LPTVKIVFDSNLDIHVVTYQGWSCSLGVFPVSIKNEDFLKVARDAETIKKSHDIRQRVRLNLNKSSNEWTMFRYWDQIHRKELVCSSVLSGLITPKVTFLLA